MKFGVYDIWHGDKLRKWIYSDHPNFNGRLSEFFQWVEQHQRGYGGVIIAAENQGAGKHISQQPNAVKVGDSHISETETSA
jgi:hypothetical protein